MHVFSVIGIFYFPNNAQFHWPEKSGARNKTVVRFKKEWRHKRQDVRKKGVVRRIKEGIAK